MDGELETGCCGKEENKWERNEHIDMSGSEESPVFLTVNITDAVSSSVFIQDNIKDESIQDMSELFRHQIIVEIFFCLCKTKNTSNVDFLLFL